MAAFGALQHPAWHWSMSPVPAERRPPCLKNKTASHVYGKNQYVTSCTQNVGATDYDSRLSSALHHGGSVRPTESPALSGHLQVLSLRLNRILQGSAVVVQLLMLLREYGRHHGVIGLTNRKLVRFSPRVGHTEETFRGGRPTIRCRARGRYDHREMSLVKRRARMCRIARAQASWFTPGLSRTANFLRRGDLRPVIGFCTRNCIR
jgi:hypothetical protein